jgi:hypothetical protein
LLAHLTTALQQGDAATARALLERQYAPIQALDENQAHLQAALTEVGAAQADLAAVCPDGSVPPALLTTTEGVQRLVGAVQPLSEATQELLLRLAERRQRLTASPAVGAEAPPAAESLRPRFTRTVGRS